MKNSCPRLILLDAPTLIQYPVQDRIYKTHFCGFLFLPLELSQQHEDICVLTWTFKDFQYILCIWDGYNISKLAYIKWNHGGSKKKEKQL